MNRSVRWSCPLLVAAVLLACTASPETEIERILGFELPEEHQVSKIGSGGDKATWYATYRATEAEYGQMVLKARLTEASACRTPFESTVGAAPPPFWGDQGRVTPAESSTVARCGPSTRAAARRTPGGTVYLLLEDIGPPYAYAP